MLGEYNANMIKAAISGKQPEHFEVSEQVPVRPPVMCPGCPHRGMFYVLKNLGLPFAAISAATRWARSHRFRALIFASVWEQASAWRTV